MKKKILVTGGDGRFSKILKQKNKSLRLFFATKKQCNIIKRCMLIVVYIEL